MAKSYRPWSPDQPYFLPPNVRKLWAARRAKRLAAIA